MAAASNGADSEALQGVYRCPIEVKAYALYYCNYLSTKCCVYKPTLGTRRSEALSL